MSAYKVISLHGSDPSLGAYLSLIHSTFKRSLRYGNDWYKLIDKDCYYQAYNQVVTVLLSRPAALVRLAVLTDDPDTCLGWSLSEEKTLHYVFVKANVGIRKLGIGTHLLPKEFNRITHLTRIGREIWQSKFPEVVFNPFL